MYADAKKGTHARINSEKVAVFFVENVNIALSISKILLHRNQQVLMSYQVFK